MALIANTMGLRQAVWDSDRQNVTTSRDSDRKGFKRKALPNVGHYSRIIGQQKPLRVGDIDSKWRMAPWPEWAEIADMLFQLGITKAVWPDWEQELRSGGTL